ncbi:hypothetical protein A499_10159 [Niallia nealsonii AAU1]|nr:hypothetical protein A499_10159 [Niallia nealsonii AAU1]
MRGKSAKARRISAKMRGKSAKARRISAKAGGYQPKQEDISQNEGEISQSGRISAKAKKVVYA